MIDDFDEQLSEQYRSRRARRRAFKRRRTLASAAVVAAITGLLIILFWQVISRQPNEVSGIVRCMSGAPVQGIYVKQARGSGSFANVDRDPTDPSVARFKSEVRGTRLYGVNVGCGPLNADKWTETPNSNYERRGYHEFNCHDDPADQLHGKCVTMK